MCLSATVSYSTAAVLASTGLYAVAQARGLRSCWMMWAAAPILFGLQQGLEGMVWQQLDAGHAGTPVPYALGYHFFSHFLWLWWFPVACYLVEPQSLRREIMRGFAMLGAATGTLAYAVIVSHPEWMSVTVMQHSVVYTYSVPFRGPSELPITEATFYALVVLVPLLISSRRHIRTFGILVTLSLVVAADAYSYAYISVWCFFAAALSVYLAYMLNGGKREPAASPL